MRPWLLAAALAACAGCEAQPCVRQSDCPSGLTCQAGVCAVPPRDAPIDGELDAGDASVALDAPASLDAGLLDAALLDVGPVDAPVDDAPGDAGPAADAP